MRRPARSVPVRLCHRHRRDDPGGDNLHDAHPAWPRSAGAHRLRSFSTGSSAARSRVGAISGSFLYDLTLENLVVRDTSGELLVDLPRVRVAYRLPNFIAGQVVLSAIELDRPTIQLIKHRNGRMNYEEVLGIGKGSKGGKSPLVEFHNVRMTQGMLRIALPWNPPKSARSESSIDSALQAERAKPGRIDRSRVARDFGGSSSSRTSPPGCPGCASPRLTGSRSPSISTPSLPG